MTKNKERMIQSIYLLALITSILLFFLCFNVHVNETQRATLSTAAGEGLTRPALIQKIDNLVMNNHRVIHPADQETEEEPGPAAYSPLTVTTGAVGGVLLSFGVKR